MMLALQVVGFVEEGFVIAQHRPVSVPDLHFLSRLGSHRTAKVNRAEYREDQQGVKVLLVAQEQVELPPLA
jgi:hypothetical protein